MPFKSKKQQGLCYYLQSKGEAGSWNCSKWSKETKQKSLPTYAPKKKK